MGCAPVLNIPFRAFVTFERVLAVLDLKLNLDWGWDGSLFPRAGPLGGWGFFIPKENIAVGGPVAWGH